MSLRDGVFFAAQLGLQQETVLFADAPQRASQFVPDVLEQVGVKGRFVVREDGALVGVDLARVGAQREGRIAETRPGEFVTTRRDVARKKNDNNNSDATLD